MASLEDSKSTAKPGRPSENMQSVKNLVEPSTRKYLRYPNN